MREFVAAASKSAVEVDESDYIDFVHEGTEVRFYQPGTGQLAYMLAMVTGKMDVQAAGGFINLMFNMMDAETASYFRERLLDRTDGFELDGENGLLEIFEGLTEEWSARPTKEPSDFQPPQQVTGKKSTATTRVRASTSSNSRSRATSR